MNSNGFDLHVHEKLSQKKGSPYLAVFISLAVLTGLEVGASFLGPALRLPILVILAAAKVLLVLLFFMHLRTDRRIFAVPIVIAFLIATPIILAISLAMPALIPLAR
jgi:caa(3)-type oxidase subunit IV